MRLFLIGGGDVEGRQVAPDLVLFGGGVERVGFVATKEKVLGDGTEVAREGVQEFRVIVLVSVLFICDGDGMVDFKIGINFFMDQVRRSPESVGVGGRILVVFLFGRLGRSDEWVLSAAESVACPVDGGVSDADGEIAFFVWEEACGRP